MLAADEYRQVHADADDGRGNGEGRARAGPGRRRRRTAGDRDGEAPGRGDRGLRRAAVGEGPGRVARRQVGRRALRNDEEREIAEGVGGYARPMPPAGWRARAAIVAERVQGRSDIVITTALIPGRPAPKLHQGRHGRGDEARLGDRRPRGGAGRQRRRLASRASVVDENGVKIIGTAEPAGDGADRRLRALRAQRAQLPRAVAQSQDRRIRSSPRDDEIVQATLVVRRGRSVVAKK